MCSMYIYLFHLAPYIQNTPRLKVGCMLMTDTYICSGFQLLSMLNLAQSSETGCKSALSLENVAKNRNQQIIPLDNMQRPYLMTYIPG